VYFQNSEFSGGSVSFSRAEFSSGQVDFTGAKFSGGKVSYNGAQFTAGKVNLASARFSNGQLGFQFASFAGSDVSFDRADFSGGEVGLGASEFTGGKVSFIGAQFTGARVGFPNALFSGSDVRFGMRVSPAAASTSPTAKPSALANWAGQIDAFLFRIQVGDIVALPLKSTPAVAFGRVTGGYHYAAEAVNAIRNQRSVEWITDGIPRELIDQDLLYSLGAFLTVCRISRNDAEQRIRALLAAPPAVVESGTGSFGATTAIAPEDATDRAVDLGEAGRDQIRKRLAQRFKGHDLARLVGALLKAEGFVCDVSPAGPDGGVDVLAGEGGMGFDGATMAVQVKSGSTVVDAPTLRELKGVMGNFGAKTGLLVSWGGFTKTARQEARRLFFEIRLWDSDAVIDKLEELYGRLPADVQADIPLQRIWTLLPDET
jgi:restriction system protein